MTTNILIVCLAAITLTACSRFPVTEIDVNTTSIERPQLVVPEVDRFSSRPVEFKVVTEQNVESIFKDLKDNNKNVVLFVLDSEMQQNLTLNMADLIKLIKQQKAIIAAYQDYYEKQKP